MRLLSNLGKPERDQSVDGQKNRVMEVDLNWRNGSWKLGQYRFPDA